MRGEKDGRGHLLVFLASAVVFVLFIAIGMLAAHNTSGEMYDELAKYLKTAVYKKTQFRQIFLKAAEADFRYTCLILICSLNIYTSAIPFLAVCFRGFCSGYAAALAADILSARGTAAVSAAIFVSVLLTVPIYILMFMLCRNFASEIGGVKMSFREKLKEYVMFAASVMIMFALLCITDCLLAAVGLVITRFK